MNKRIVEETEDSSTEGKINRIVTDVKVCEAACLETLDVTTVATVDGSSPGWNQPSVADVVSKDATRKSIEQHLEVFSEATA